MQKPKSERAIFYRLNEETIDAVEWMAWCRATNDGKEYLRGSGGAELSVDTVFLGIDHELADGPQLLIQTIVKGGPHDRRAWLSATLGEAQQRHQEACKLVGIEAPPRFRLV